MHNRALTTSRHEIFHAHSLIALAACSQAASCDLWVEPSVPLIAIVIGRCQKKFFDTPEALMRDWPRILGYEKDRAVRVFAYLWARPTSPKWCTLEVEQQ